MSTNRNGSNLAKHGIPEPDHYCTPTWDNQQNPKKKNTSKRIGRGQQVKQHGDRLELG
jgi:hypothetical protein